MVFSIGGTDLRRFLAPKGFQWRRRDREGRNAGDVMSGEHIRDRLDVKEVLEIKLRALSTNEAALVLSAIEPEYVSVTYTSPRAGGAVTRRMYVNLDSKSHAFSAYIAFCHVQTPPSRKRRIKSTLV